MKFDLLVNSIEQTHSHFQQQASKAVNVSLTLRNWLIGFYIVEYEQKGEDKAKYGEKLLTKLAERCTSIKGLDERTFRNFRLLYLYYPQIQSLITLQSQIPPIRRSLTTESGNNENHETEFQIWGSLTTEFQLNDFQLKAEIIVNSLSYTHIEQLPTVGILLVTNKNNALVEYATAGMDANLFVSKYLLKLPKKEVLEEFIKLEIEKWNS
jgi:hypothetical protein